MAPDETTDGADGLQPLRKIVTQLRERLAQQEGRVAEVFAALRDDMSRLSQQVDRAAQAAAARARSDEDDDDDADEDDADEKDDEADEDDEHDPLGFIESRRQGIGTPAALPPAVAASSSVAGDASALEQLVFGPELAAHGTLSDERRQLLRDLMSGHPAAMALAGAILQFRSASGEKMPQLLKDIGEAWYAWRPDTAETHDELREALTGFLQRKCDEAGATNVIELVRPGDRYDSKRHHARTPGVEVVSVGGWVVLRDNGKVYTKASVTVK